MINVASGRLPVKVQLEERLAGERAKKLSGGERGHRAEACLPPSRLGSVVFSFSSILPSFFFVVNKTRS